MYELMLMQSMSERQRVLFITQMNTVRKDETVGVLLALFLGGFGAHRFYLGDTGLAIVYLIFCWTFIPGLIAFIECFFMPGRVRRYNYSQAETLSLQIRAAFPNG